MNTFTRQYDDLSLQPLGGMRDAWLTTRGTFSLSLSLYQVHLNLTEDQNKLLPRLSSALQSEVAWTAHRLWLVNIWFLRDAEKEMQIELAAYLNAKVFAPDELCPSGVMYIVHRGTAFWGGKVRRTPPRLRSTPGRRSNIAPMPCVRGRLFMLAACGATMC